MARGIACMRRRRASVKTRAAFCFGRYNFTTVTLTLGARLGPYEIVSPLGAGGMGEVYRARDTRWPNCGDQDFAGAVFFRCRAKTAVRARSEDHFSTELGSRSKHTQSGLGNVFARLPVTWTEIHPRLTSAI